MWRRWQCCCRPPSVRVAVPSCNMCHRPCQPSPTLSPIDPVPRGLLTLCLWASSGPQGLYTAYIQPICSLYAARREKERGGARESIPSVPAAWSRATRTRLRGCILVDRPAMQQAASSPMHHVARAHEHVCRDHEGGLSNLLQLAQMVRNLRNACVHDRQSTYFPRQVIRGIPTSMLIWYHGFDTWC